MPSFLWLAAHPMGRGGTTFSGCSSVSACVPIRTCICASVHGWKLFSRLAINFYYYSLTFFQTTKTFLELTHMFLFHFSNTHGVVRLTAKSQEIIFTDQRRKTKFSISDKIPLLQRVQTIKILGVTFTSSLSVTLHAQSVIAACAQTL